MGDDWRVIAQRALTGEFLTYDLPLTQQTSSKELSGPGGVFGTIEPDMFKEVASDGRPLLEEWSTALFIEQAGQIRNGGLISHLSKDKPRLNVEAPGFSAWPVGQPYTANHLPTAFQDPVDLYRQVWTHLQSFPNSNLGVTVDEAQTWLYVSGGSGPFKIFDYDARDCGDLLSSIAQGVPLDYAESHWWADDNHSAIRHNIDIGFPRLGRKRTELRFTDGENIIDYSAVGANGDTFSNDVYGYGEGSGPGMLKCRASVQDGRIRRATSVNYRAANNQGYLDQLTKRELAQRALLDDVSELTIIDTPGAPVSALAPGDDILATLDLQWVGVVSIWLRVLAINEAGDTPGVAVLKTQRSDTFSYLADTSPTGLRVIMQL
jgi:hypothetical protein